MKARKIFQHLLVAIHLLDFDLLDQFTLIFYKKIHSQTRRPHKSLKLCDDGAH